MARPVPPQVIPRPADWRSGARAPWSRLPVSERSGIDVDRVRHALAAQGQTGAAPAGIGSGRVLGSPILRTGSPVPEVRVVNAAVLALLFDEAGEAHLVLTRRSSSLRSHRGEVSFPGGRLDAGEDAPSAALREAYEEVALDPAHVRTVGWIHPVLTMMTESLIMPIVASVPSRPHLVASPAEVERVFDVPLSELADPANFHEELWRVEGHQIPGSDDDSFTVWFFEVEGEMIWGATARMIHELLSIVLVAAG